MDFLHSWIIPPESTAPLAYPFLAAAALFFVSVDKGGLGGGLGIVSVPLLMQAAPLDFSIGMWLPVLVVCDFCTVRSYPSEWRFSAISKLAPIVLLAIAGTTFALKWMDLKSGSPQLEAWLKLSIAIMSIVFLILRMRPAPDEIDAPWIPTWPASIVTGIIGGITTTIAHAAGPVFTMYLLPQKLGRREYIGTTGRFYFTMNSLKIPSFVAANLVNLHTLRYGVWLMLLSPLGVLLGSWLNRRMSPIWFVRIVHASLVLVSVKFTWDAWKVLS